MDEVTGGELTLPFLLFKEKNLNIIAYLYSYSGYLPLAKHCYVKISVDGIIVAEAGGDHDAVKLYNGSDAKEWLEEYMKKKYPGQVYEIKEYRHSLRSKFLLKQREGD